jgi:hypothetical protein
MQRRVRDVYAKLFVRRSELSGIPIPERRDRVHSTGEHRELGAHGVSALADADCGTYPDAASYLDADAAADCDADPASNTDAEADTYTDAEADAVAHTDPDAAGHCVPYTDAEADADAELHVPVRLVARRRAMRWRSRDIGADGRLGRQHVSRVPVRERLHLLSQMERLDLGERRVPAASDASTLPDAASLTFRPVRSRHRCERGDVVVVSCADRSERVVSRKRGTYQPPSDLVQQEHWERSPFSQQRQPAARRHSGDGSLQIQEYIR